MEQFLNKRQIADRLMVSTRTIDRLIENGMPHTRVLGQYRFVWATVLEWLERTGGKSDEQSDIL